MRKLVYVLYDYEGVYSMCNSQLDAEKVKEEAIERTAKRYNGDETAAANYHRFEIVPTRVEEGTYEEYNS